jgi:hypothetical protein
MIFKPGFWVILVAIAANPLAAWVVGVTEGWDTFRYYGLGMYVLGTAFNLAPAMAAILLARAYERPLESPFLGKANLDRFVHFLAVSLILIAQYISWRDIKSDAQASLLFVFLPLWAGAFIAMLYVFLATILGRMGRK